MLLLKPEDGKLFLAVLISEKQKNYIHFIIIVTANLPYVHHLV